MAKPKPKRKPDFSKPKPKSINNEETLNRPRNEFGVTQASVQGDVVRGDKSVQDDSHSETDNLSCRIHFGISESLSDNDDEILDFGDDFAKMPESDEGDSPATTKFSPEKSYINLPTLAIVGRPNVGKSTLFNRFMRRRLAIVDPTPGVTRDPVEGTAFIYGKPVHLIDTGGYKLERDTGSMEAVMDELVVQKTLATLKNADLILLLLEAGKITGEDEEFIKTLRPYWKKVVCAVNKCEGGKNEDVAWNYLQFGFENLLFVSADHGDHISELAKLLTERMDFSKVEEGEPEADPIKIAIMGKPNTGKSTLSNRLTHSEASIVSDYAGTTRDVVEGEFRYKERRFEVLDTAGIRRKAKVKENVEYYSVNRAIKTLDRCDIVFLMIDCNEGLTEQDKKICALAYECGRGIIFILNKWDTKEDQSRATFRKTSEYIKIMFGHMQYAPILPLSALLGEGVKDLLNTALTLYDQLTRKVDTAALNAALKDWLIRYPPPATKAIHFKIRYMTQTSTNPVKFLLFATSPDNVPESYVSYLKNRIREDLGFDQIPVALEMKASRKKWEQRQEERGAS